MTVELEGLVGLVRRIGLPACWIAGLLDCRIAELLLLLNWKIVGLMKCFFGIGCFGFWIFGMG